PPARCLNETESQNYAIKQELMGVLPSSKEANARAQCVDAILTISSKRMHAQKGLPVLDTLT
ncbi:hypothetical protein, partial [Tateyamaria pelophila]|uniref:hypothetical protein n=1 Tax=Tateyamaria pelophila TaxID=328415 RepID=UPI001CBBABAB